MTTFSEDPVVFSEVDRKTRGESKGSNVGLHPDRVSEVGSGSSFPSEKESGSRSLD